MLGLLRRIAGKPIQPRTAPRFARLGLERLEGRAVPASLAFSINEVPPSLTLSISYVSDRVVNLSGTLSGVINPSMQLISFTGKVSDSTTTNSMGQFSINTPASGLGDVTATSIDGSNATATATIADVVPTLTLHAAEYPGRLWEFSGTVTYTGRNPDMLSVTLGGVPVSMQNKTATTNSSGYYSTNVFLNGTVSDNGTVWAKVTTPWGTESEEALDDVHQSGT